jgi:hypothetical protein
LIAALSFPVDVHAERLVHWSYRKPVAPERPQGRAAEWCRDELDFFALAAMEKAGLAPSPAAGPGTLLRRVSLDLTGLPPTLEERERFLADAAPGAYERAVDRLLASPRYGERWAALWLDLARFADTQGYEKDNLRTIWAYRDWVIKAFNDDVPYDRFTVEQLAGDLLPNPTDDQLVATAFHRNTMTNTEGGTDDEEFRLKAAIDRVNTTATAWMGLTAGCAQCHDHPSEPMPQREFYGLLAFFNNTADADRDDDAPVITVVPLAERGRAEGEAPPETLVPVMRELTGPDRRVTRRLHRGNWLDPREEVSPATPAFLHAYPAGAERDRLGLARWLVSPENPLTARVMVNRIWEQLFGTGLVETPDDFGTSGAAPSNQALLDSLAVRFQGEMGWSVKRLVRAIVLSATYRQSSEATAERRAADPDNRLLARGPRFRLPAEMIRDQALSAAGLLSGKMYGRSVMPAQPEGVWSVVYNVQRWVPSRGEDGYRRALYTFWRRTSPYPAATLFDAPARESCTARRVRTNTPSAALVTLNDPVYVEAAGALGRRMLAEGGNTDEERIRHGWKLLLAREPSAVAIEQLVALLHAAAGTVEPYTAVAAALLNLDEVLCKE